MRFSPLQATLLSIIGYYSGLIGAQDCGTTVIDFEDLTNVPALGTGLGANLIPNGYQGLNWANLYGVAPSPALQFLLPQGKVFAATLAGPNLDVATISARNGGTFQPVSIFLGTFATNAIGGAASLSTASEITVTAAFGDGTTGETSFNFDPPDTLAGLELNAEALQIFRFPCDWTDVTSLTLTPQSENGVNTNLGLALDDLEIED